MSLPGRMQVRYVGEKPIVLFERWIEPGELREINVKQWPMIERKFPGKFDLLGSSEMVRGRAVHEPPLQDESPLQDDAFVEEGSDGDGVGDVGKPARKRRARARRGA
jgi:hypothetical protein